MRNFYNFNHRNVTLVIVMCLLFLTPFTASSVLIQYFRSAASGDWSTNNTWEMSNDGTNWAVATTTPGALSTVTIQSGHIVTLTAATSVNVFTLNSGATINLSNFTLTIAGTTTINGIIKLLINSATVNGKMVTNSTSAIDVTNLSITATSDVSYTPTAISSFSVLSAPSTTFTGEISVLNLDLPWILDNWSLGQGTHLIELIYDPTLTTINRTKTSTYAYASNGKLIYSGGEVYNASGIKVAAASSASVVALRPGIYFVKSGNRTQKIVLP